MSRAKKQRRKGMTRQPKPFAPLRLFASLLFLCASLHAAEFQLATFACEVTIPLGHPCMGGGIAPAKRVVEPLQAKGFVLVGADKPFVVVAFDWCEIRGSAFDDWRAAL